jgi:hypothetical protein
VFVYLSELCVDQLSAGHSERFFWEIDSEALEQAAVVREFSVVATLT